MNEADTALESRTESTGPAPRRPYGSLVLGAILVVVGGLWLLDAVDVISLRAAVVLPGVLAVVGLALMFGALDGPHSGLVVFGLFLTVAVMAAAVAPPRAFHGGVGERSHVVSAQRDLQTNYDVALGDLSLDFSGLTLTESAEVEVTVGAGQMLVVIPSDIPVEVEASVGAGEIDLLGDRVDGVSRSTGYTSPGFAEADATLTLDLNVVAGQIEVTR